MRRIAVIIGKMNMGGVEHVVMDYYKNLDHDRYQFDFYVDGDSGRIPYKEIQKMGGRVFVLPQITKLCIYRKVLKKYLLREGYQIMHVHLNTLSVFPLSVGKSAGIPIRICHNHSTSSKKEFVRDAIKKILRLFNGCYATHKAACSEFAATWMFGKKTTQNGNVKILKDSISTERFCFDEEFRNSFRREYNLENAYILMHIGRFVPQKNHDRLLDIFAECLKKNANARLLLVGEGPLEYKVKQKARELGIINNIIFMGVRKDVNKLLSVADVFLLPSIYEGFGIVAIEAQAAGLHCVCSTAVPMEVKMTNDVDFVDVNDIEMWAKLALQERQIDRNEAYNKIKKQQFDIKQASNDLMTWYDSLINPCECKAKISVVVPVYNVENYLSLCVDSILQQTYSNIEVVLVDDGSTDNSGKICDSYLIDDRVKVIHQENGGLSSARNAGFRESNGTYFTFIDSDDFISPYYIENLYNAINNDGVDMACCGFEKFCDETKVTISGATHSIDIEKQDDYIRHVLYQKLECNAWGKLYKKDVFDQLTYPVGKLYEDVAVLPYVFDRCKKVGVSWSNDYFYRQREYSILHNGISQRDFDCVEHMDLLKEYIHQHIPKLNNAMACRYFSAISSLFVRIGKENSKDQKDCLWQLIKRDRWSVLRNVYARKKAWMAAFVSLFGPKVFKAVFRLVQK